MKHKNANSFHSLLDLLQFVARVDIFQTDFESSVNQ